MKFTVEYDEASGYWLGTGSDGVGFASLSTNPMAALEELLLNTRSDYDTPHCVPENPNRNWSQAYDLEAGVANTEFDGPSEVIALRAYGALSDEDMMAALLGMRYTFGYVPQVGGVSTDAYERGTWDDVELAYYQGHLSESEFQQLFNAKRGSS